MSLTNLLLPAQGRLTPEDVRVLARVSSLLPAAWRVGNVQPSRSEQRAVPRAEAVSGRKWDLRYRSADAYDALIVARPSALPGGSQARLQSALMSCRVLLVFDEIAPSLPADRRLGELALPRGSLHVYRGEGTDTLLRVDDYPTGVRPILDDLTSLHDVLSQIDEAGLAFHLGVVPALLRDDMTAFLRGLKNLVVCMHGYEHGYAQHSKILIDAGDPSNQRGTVTGFDEFAGRSYADVERTLRQGRQSLAERVGQTPRGYIPPNNESSRATGRALAAAGFEYVLTEKPIFGCELPCIRSDFYDRSSAFRLGSRPRVASLHATWEADLLRAGDTQSLRRFLAELVAQRRRAREEAESVGARLTAALEQG